MATKSLQILGSLNQTAVEFIPQELTDEQKAQARENIGAAGLDDVGGGLTEVDWETNIINKPFYDDRVIINYSYDENPNPISFDCAAMGYSFYKISDLVLTKEEIFGSKITINDRERDNFTESNVLIETDELVIVQYSDNGYIFCSCNTVGTCNFTFMGYSLSVDVPEVGLYRMNYLGAGMSDASSIEFIIGGELKTLDLKYLPENMALGYEEKPFDDITWDGNVTDKEMVTVLEMEMPEDEGGGLAGYYLVKISDTPIANASDVIGGYIQKYLEGQVYEPDEITSDIVISDNNCWWLVSNGISYMINVTSLPASIDLTDALGVTVELPSTGVYFIGGYFNRDFTTPMEYTVALKPNSKIVTIDPKFIPANLDFDLSDYYTKVEADNRYYSKGEVDTALDTALGNIDLSGYYTKTEIDNLIGDVDAVLNEINALIGE